MNDAPFDDQAAHRRFAARCFNEAWNLIDQTDRSAADDRQLVRLVHASHWHWTQVEGVTAENLSIAYWQTARVYALLGDADNARRYAVCCLEVSSSDDDVEPFFLAYAHEAAARAASVAGDSEAMQTHRDEAARIAATLEDEDSRKQLQQDLATIS